MVVVVVTVMVTIGFVMLAHHIIDFEVLLPLPMSVYIKITYIVVTVDHGDGDGDCDG